MKLKEILEKISKYENLELYDNKERIDMYEQWYNGKSSEFHNYKVYNGKKFIYCTRMSLGMAKKVCEDWANLLINEKTDIVLSNEQDSNTLQNILKDCRFWKKANQGVEKAFALGQCAGVVNINNISTQEDGSIEKDGTISVGFYSAKKIIPISIEDEEIVECAFINKQTGKVKISIHLRDENGNYVIHNLEAKGKDEDNLTIDEDSYYTFNTLSPLPWFAIIKPNVCNNIDIDSPMGMSIFANSIDTLKEIDLIFDSYANEFALGKKRIFISAKQQQIDMKTGEVTDTFDSNDVVIYVLPDDDDGNNFYQDSTTALRVSDHQLGLQNQLNLLSYQCGFGTQHYKFEQGGIATATQIVSENSDMFRNIRKHEIIIEEVLTTLVRAIIYASNTFTPYNIVEGQEINIKFDDSIIEDKKSEREQDRLDVSMGVMGKVEYRSKWYNEDEITAEKAINDMSVFSIQDDEEFALQGEQTAQNPSQE